MTAITDNPAVINIMEKLILNFFLMKFSMGYNGNPFTLMKNRLSS